MADNGWLPRVSCWSEIVEMRGWRSLKGLVASLWSTTCSHTEGIYECALMHQYTACCAIYDFFSKGRVICTEYGARKKFPFRVSYAADPLPLSKYFHCRCMSKFNTTAFFVLEIFSSGCKGISKQCFLFSSPGILDSIEQTCVSNNLHVSHTECTVKVLVTNLWYLRTLCCYTVTFLSTATYKNEVTLIFLCLSL